MCSVLPAAARCGSWRLPCPPARKELSDRLWREPSLCFISRLHRQCEENACPAEAVSAVQNGDDLGFNLRSSLKPARSSSPSFPGGSTCRRQCTKTRSNLEGCSHLGRHPRCPCRQAITTRKWQSQRGFNDACKPTIFNLLWFNEASLLLQGKLVVSGGGALLFFSISHWCCCGFQKPRWDSREANILITWERSQGETGFSKMRTFLGFLPVIFTAQSNEPRNPYLSWNQSPDVTQLRVRERRHLI